MLELQNAYHAKLGFLDWITLYLQINVHVNLPTMIMEQVKL